MLLFIAANAAAEEGMFLFTNPPKKAVADRFGFEMTDAWLQRVQKSSIRFPNGSASFVSPEGLVLTNHHVGASQIQELSTKENDLLANGFCAKTREEELPCKNTELLVLQSIEDVTGRVKDHVGLSVALFKRRLELEKAGVLPEETSPTTSSEVAEKARRAVIAAIEKESLDTTGLKSNVVTLYQGGQYHLYRYKVYTDVRLVFAPEQQAASFGGDPDNFEYPRYCLDCAFFRVYENGEPAATPDHLGWARENVKDGEPVFVSGHPGRTNREYIYDHLCFQRDFVLPRTMQRLYRLESLYSVWAERSEENRRRGKNELDYIKNSRKVRLGQLAGLQDPVLIGPKFDPGDLNSFRSTKDAEGEWKTEVIPGNPDTKRIYTILESWREFYDDYMLFEGGDAFNSKTFQIARTLVRLARESEKPNAERLREFQDANLETLKSRLFSDAPIYEDLEILKLTDSLSLLLTFRKDVIPAGPARKVEGEPNPVHPAGHVMGDTSPIKRATELVKGSKLRDVAERKRLAEGGLKAIEASDDPMIEFALLVDFHSRKLRTRYETDIEEPLKQAYAKLAEARFEKYGDTLYPDATFTLRLSYGAVKGYAEDDGTAVPPWTVLSGLYDRAALHTNQPPFDLTESWVRAREALDPETPFNLVSTNDIIGGNSGSPLLNTNAEVVGLIFDGNLQSLTGDMVYTDIQSRAVSVHAAIILEALRKVYGMERIAEELTGP